VTGDFRAFWLLINIYHINEKKTKTKRGKTKGNKRGKGGEVRKKNKVEKRKRWGVGSMRIEKRGH